MVVHGKMYTSYEQYYHAKRAMRHKNLEVLGQIISKHIREDNENSNEKEQTMRTIGYGLRPKFSIPALKKKTTVAHKKQEYTRGFKV